MSALTIIFAKEPVPGQVKTRLAPPLPPEAARRLYHSFLEDTLEETLRLKGMAIALAYTPAGAGGFFRRLAPATVQLFSQEGLSLGERMARAFSRSFAGGFKTVLLRSSDAPDLPSAALQEARDVLAAGVADLVLGPSPDGGYYLVGLGAPCPELFEGLAWSTGTVLTETLRRARKLSLEVHLLPRWRDIDTFADLLAFLDEPHPPGRPGWRSDRTARELLAASDSTGQNETIRSADAGKA